MKIKSYLFAALVLIAGVLPLRAQTPSRSLATEIESLVAPIQKLPNQYEPDGTLRLMSFALARLGNSESALRITNSLQKEDWQSNPRDEVWRITARRLAWQGNLNAATRSANRIEGEYSRADALLSIARAQLRNGNPNAAKALLRQVAPVITQSKSPHAMSYLAFLFARVGDNKAARELFAQAKVVKDPNSMEQYGLSDRRTTIIAPYQACAGFSNEALKTASKDVFSMNRVKDVLAQRREWQPLLAFSQKLPPAQEIYFLLELSGAQLQAKDSKAARASFLLAESKFSKIPDSQFQGKDKNRDKWYLPYVFSLLQIGTGDAAGGRVRFAQLSQQPGFPVELELGFHAILSGAFGDFVSPLTAQEKIAEEKIMLALISKIKDLSDRTSYLTKIAQAQQKRGDTQALRQTLKLARQSIRQNLAAPLEKFENTGIRRMNTASRLLALAKIERDAGLVSQARSTLAQAELLTVSRPRLEVAESLLRSGLIQEAVPILHNFVFNPNSAEFKQNISSTTNNWNSLARLAAQHAIKSGPNAPLKWVLKIPDASLRAKCLTGIAFSQTRTPSEEAEMILGGDKNNGISIKASIRFPGYGASYNFDDDLD